MPKEDQFEVLELMAVHEEVIGQLYARFAVQMPPENELWNGLAQEEKNHAFWIRTFRDKAIAENVHVDANRFPPKAIKNSIGHVKELIVEAGQREEMSLKEQLAIALDLENGLIEKRYFEITNSDDPELRNLLDQLKVATQEHARRIKNEWEKVKN